MCIDTPQPVENADAAVIADFGSEWLHFNQQGLSEADRRVMFKNYFSIFPWERLSPGAEGFDLGCGTGRWAKMAAPRVGTLHCIEPSPAIEAARANLAGMGNCRLHRTTVDAMPLADGSCDFGYSLGVLHHIPDTAAGIAACARKLKPGAPLLLYLYYAFDNRPGWFRALWRCSDRVRRWVAKTPRGVKFALCEGIAVGVYWPLARLARLAEMAGINPAGMPLSFYRSRSLYVMRTDALDRFGTKLEHRFTRDEITAMMEAAGLGEIHFSEHEPYWCAVGIRKRSGAGGGR